MELISRQAGRMTAKEAIATLKANYPDACFEQLREAVDMAIAALEQPTITHEQAIDYLHETGWLQNHDRILTESRVPLKGTWKDFTDEGYVECPFCKSATNCESKEEIDDIHFCFSCGAMLKRGEADEHN